MPNPTATVMIPYHALDDLLQTGTRANQPAASAVTPGTLYSVTDEGNRLERSNGTSWALYAPTGGGGGGGTPDPHQATHAPGGSDEIVDAAWVTQPNLFDGDQTIDGDLLVTGTITPMTAEQRDRINALIGDPTGARTLMSSSFVSGLSLRHDEGLEIGRITCGNYDTQTYQPLIVEVESFQVHSGVSPSVRVEHVRVHPSGGVTVGAGADHASDPGVGIVKARGLDGTPLDASQVTSGLLPDARLSSNVPRLNTANVFTANQWVEKRLTLNDPTQPANQKRWDLTAAGPTAGSLSIYPVDDNSTGQFANGIVLQRTGTLTAPGGLSSTPLNATQLTSGTVPDARLSANVQMKPVAQSDVTNLVSDLAAKAALASPAFTGVPTAATAAVGNTSTQVATTAFVQAQLAASFTPIAWTPIDASGAGLTLSGSQCQYLVIGKLVLFLFGVTWPTTSNTATATVGGLPYLSAVQSAGVLSYSEVPAAERIFIQFNQAYFQPTPTQTNATMSGKTIIGNGWYFRS